MEALLHSIRKDRHHSPPLLASPDYRLWIRALGQDVQQVHGCHKVEPWEGNALGFQVVLQEGDTSSEHLANWSRTLACCHTEPCSTQGLFESLLYMPTLLVTCRAFSQSSSCCCMPSNRS